ncbi:unnamed protein product [Musa acuminata subsp. burmannicoides]
MPVASPVTPVVARLATTACPPISFLTSLSSPSPESAAYGFRDSTSTLPKVTFGNYSDHKDRMISPVTEDGSVDRMGKPAVKARTGNWTSAVLLLVNYGLVTFAFFGVGVNLVLFLTRVLQQDNADAANNVSKWTGTVYIFSLIGHS